MPDCKTILKSIFLIVFIFIPAESVLAVSPEQLSDKEYSRALKGVNINLQNLYFDLLLTKERRTFLKLQIETLKSVFNNQALTLETFRGDYQYRQSKFTELVISMFSSLRIDYLPPTTVNRHVLDAFAESGLASERQEVTDWYSKNRLIFGRLNADDWTGSLTELVSAAASKAALQYPDTRSIADLADQFAYILLEIHETYWRPRGLRLLGYKMARLSEKHGDQLGFQYMLDHMATLFETSDTLWFKYDLIMKPHQQDLANYFIADRRSDTGQRTFMSEREAVTDKEQRGHNFVYGVIAFFVTMVTGGLCLRQCASSPQNKAKTDKDDIPPSEDQPSSPNDDALDSREDHKKKKHQSEKHKPGYPAAVDVQTPCMAQQSEFLVRGTTADQQFKEQQTLALQSHSSNQHEPDQDNSGWSFWTSWDTGSSWTEASGTSYSYDSGSSSSDWASSGPSNDEVYDREGSY